MIENNNPEIDVDEIMAKIRKEITNRSKRERTFSVANNIMDGNRFCMDFQRITENLAAADDNALVGTKILPMTRYPKPIRWLAKLVARIILYLTEIITFPQRKFNQSMLQSIRELMEVSRNMATEVAELNTRLIENIQRFEKKYDSLLESHDRRITDEISNIKKESEAQYHQTFERLQGIKKDILYLKTDLIFQGRRLSMFLEEARKRLPEDFSEQQLQSFSKELPRMQNPLYVAFEDEFRGSRHEIRERLKVYLPLVKKAQAGTHDRLLIDIGCGRGEWLELLEKERLVAKGIDINAVLIAQNLERQLDVLEADAFSYLQSLRNNSIGALTAFHFVEHLSFPEIIKLLDEGLRVLKSGGILILETPNPANILMGACDFYSDPTHKNPIPDHTLKFLVESRGFCNVDIMHLNACEQEVKIKEDDLEVTRRFNQFFYGPRDYAVFGYKI